MMGAAPLWSPRCGGGTEIPVQAGMTVMQGSPGEGMMEGRA